MDPLSVDEIEVILSGPFGDIEDLATYRSQEKLARRGFKFEGPSEKPISILSEIWNEGGVMFEDRIVAPLGFGVYGAAYLLTDGSVLKFSQSQVERECVFKIVDKEIRSIHLPDIYELGVVSPDSRWFYYVREPLDDIPFLREWIEKEIIHRTSEKECEFRDADAWIDAWIDHIEPIFIELRDEFGIDISYDCGPENWGIRPEGDPKVLVLRDVACTFSPDL